MNEVIDVAPAPVREVANAQAGALAPTTPAVLLELALQRGASMEQLAQLMDMQFKWEANEARKAHAAALTVFKSNPPEILKDKHVYYQPRGSAPVSYDHASLGNVVQCIVQGLAQAGITHRWITEQVEGKVRVTCRLTHKSGHFEDTTLESAPDSSGGKNPIQSIASAVSYLERYTLLLATGLATKDMPLDDDGASAGEGVPDDSPLARWKAQAWACSTEAELDEVVRGGVNEFKNDRPSYDQFRVAVTAHRNTLKGISNA